MKNKLLLVVSSLSAILLASCNTEQCEVCKVCEECAQCEPCPHVHSYSEEWSSNEHVHWREATCCPGEYQKDLGEHQYDSNGFCVICNHETIENYKKVTFSGEHCRLTNAQETYHINSEVTFLIELDENYIITNCSVTGLNDLKIDKETGVITGVVADDISISVTTKDSRIRYYISSVGGVYNDNNEKMYKTYTYDEDTRTVTIEDVLESTEVGMHNIDTFTYSEDHLTKTHRHIFDDEANIGDITIFKYDESGNLLEESSYSVFGDEISFHNKRVHTYDEFNRVTSVFTYEDEECETTPYNKYIYEYFEGYSTYKAYSYDETTGQYKCQLFYEYVETIDVENEWKIIQTYSCKEGSDVRTYYDYEKYDLKTGKILQEGSFDCGLYVTNFEYNEFGDCTYLGQIVKQDETEYEIMTIESSYDENGFLDSMYLSARVSEEEFIKNAGCAEYEKDELGRLDSVKFYSDVYPEKATLSSEYEYETLIVEDWMPEELIEAYMPGSYPFFYDSYDAMFLNYYLPL